MADNTKKTSKEPDIHSKGHFIPFVAEEYEHARKNFERLGLPFGPPPKPTKYYKGDPDAAKENK